MRFGRWSNPNILFDGQPCGVSTPDYENDSHSVATFYATSWNRENWRNPRFDTWVQMAAPFPWTGTFPNPFPTVQHGVNAVFSGANSLVTPVLHIQAESYPETVTIFKNGIDIQLFVQCVVAGGACSCADVDGIPGLTNGDVSAFVRDLLNGSSCP
jgi:hypothetical protein